MSNDIETARRYRYHAAGLRRMAAADEDPKIRETLIELAQDYESMAQGHETIKANYVNNVIPLNAGIANRKG